MIELRPYQRVAVDSITPALTKHDATLLVASVGAGKTIIQATYFRELRQGYPGIRCLSLVHTRELVQQNYMAMLRTWPSAPASVNSAALGMRSTRAAIIFASIQSVYKAAREIGHVDIVFIDEAHLIPRKTSTMYQAFIADLRAINPELKIVGMSGTHFRLDSGYLHKGPDALFESVCFEIGIRELVELGFLVPAVSKAPETTLDVAGVHKRGGEFIASELQDAVNQASVTGAAVNEIVAHGVDRQSWLLFCSGVEHSYAVRDAVRRTGASCETVEGTMPARERSRIIDAFRAGHIRCVTNVNVLSVGFDYTAVDLIGLLRPTMSPGLYIQQIGRGLRLHPGKSNVLILDHALNVQRHGPVDAVRIKEPGEGGGVAPVKVCPDCASILHTAVRVCPDCGFAFPAFDPDARLQETASTAAVMSSEVKPEWLPVASWRFVRHVGREGKPDSVRVEYRAGIAVYKEWVLPAHQGFARQKSERWWRQHGGAEMPLSVESTLKAAGALSCPAEILVRRAGKYFEVVSRRFEKVEVAA